MEDVYPHEVTHYLRRIQRDTAHERLMQLSIAHNPHTKDPNYLVALLKQPLDQREDPSYFQKDRMNHEDMYALKDLARQLKRR